MPTIKATKTKAAANTDGLIREVAAKYPTLLDVDHPVYCLPRKTLGSLRRARPHKPPFLDESDHSFEVDFTSLCKNLNAIGTWKDMPVRYACLQDRQLQTAPSDLREGNRAEEQTRGGEPGTVRTIEVHLRLKGYAGWLVTDHGFLAARDELAMSWNTLPPSERPRFPLQREQELPVPLAGAGKAAPGVARFRHEVNELLDHWGLMCMVTWDLPEPQIPLIPASITNDATSIPRHGLHIVLPVHYPVIGSDEVLFEIQRLQANLAVEFGLDPSIAGLPHHEVFGQMLEMEHIERTIRTRYASRSRKAGLVQAVEFAIADAVGIRLNHVKRLRKAISACKRGKRETVSWLKSRARRHVG